MSSGIAERWRVLSGSNNWEGLLDPFDSDLRRYLIHYGSMVIPIADSFINEPASQNVGLPRYNRRNLLSKTGADKGTPFRYEVTKYIYAPSRIPSPTQGGDEAEVPMETNWIGYVAVATDEGKVALGRRDILIAWRGTARVSEWIQNYNNIVVARAKLIFGNDSDDNTPMPLVHKGRYDIYTLANPSSPLNQKSARDQVREEVARLLDVYKGGETSITVTGISLGATLSTFTSVDLAINPVSDDAANVPITAFLFGSARIGDRGFKNAFESQRNLRALRIFDVNDDVPQNPIEAPLQDGIGIQVQIPFEHVGVGLELEARLSEYLKPDLDNSAFHDLNLILHGVDGYQRSQGGFEPHGYFDIPIINKYQDALKEEYHIPAIWFNIPNKGMVHKEDGTWVLDDHEEDDDKF